MIHVTDDRVELGHDAAMSASSAPQPAAIIWERDTTPGPHPGRVGFSIAATVLCGFGAFAAVMADDLGSVPFFAVGWVVLVAAIFAHGFFQDRMRRQHPTVGLVGDMLHWHDRSVRLPDVALWTADITTTTHHNASGPSSRTSRLVARFTTHEATLVEFGWGAPRDGEVDELRAALRSVLPDAEQLTS